MLVGIWTAPIVALVRLQHKSTSRFRRGKAVSGLGLQVISPAVHERFALSAAADEAAGSNL